MDRPMGSKHPKWNFIYPVNYGEVSGTKAPDGEAVDAYLLGVFEPINEFKGDCIAVIRRINDDDDKLVVVPKGLKYSDEQIKALVEFQERFFSSEIIRNKEDLR
jgi:inorganic pyrophosphatase